jgi:hypothetical protein
MVAAFRKRYKGMKRLASVVSLYHTTSMSFLNPGAIPQHPKRPSGALTGCLVLYLLAMLDLVSWPGGLCTH